jgi:hypothetical protein
MTQGDRGRRDRRLFGWTARSFPARIADAWRDIAEYQARGRGQHVTRRIARGRYDTSSSRKRCGHRYGPGTRPRTLIVGSRILVADEDREKIAPRRVLGRDDATYLHHGLGGAARGAFAHADFRQGGGGDVDRHLGFGGVGASPINGDWN